MRNIISQKKLAVNTTEQSLLAATRDQLLELPNVEWLEQYLWHLKKKVVVFWVPGVPYHSTGNCHVIEESTDKRTYLVRWSLIITTPAGSRHEPQLIIIGVGIRQ